MKDSSNLQQNFKGRESKAPTQSSGKKRHRS
jgi:hypothetical protein